MSRAVGSLLGRHPALLYALLTPLAFPIGEMLRHGERAVQYAHDVFDGDLPRLASIPADWRQFGPSLWDPHLTAGNALLSQFALPPFAPDVLLSFVVPPFTAYAVTYAVLIGIAGYGMHLFLRDSLRLPIGACLVGGILYTLSFWHYILGFAVPLLPLHLWLTHQLASGTGRRWRCALGLILLGTFELYAGLLQLVALLAVVQFTYIIAVSSGSRGMIRSLADAGAPWVVAGALFAPVALTQLVYLPISHRLDWHEPNPLGPVQSLTSAIHFYSAVLVGVPVNGVQGLNSDIYGTFFTGAIGLPLVLLGAMSARADPRARFFVALLVVIPLIDVVASVVEPRLGGGSVLGSFQLVRVRHFIPFALAPLAALGVAHAVQGRWRHVLRGRLHWALMAGLIGVLVLEAAIAIAHAASSHEVGQRTRYGWILAAVAISSGLAVLAIIVAASRLRRLLIPTGMLTALLVGALLIERVGYARAERYLDTGLGSFADLMTIDDAQEFIRTQPNAGAERTLTAGPADGGAHPNRMLLIRAFEAGGYETNYPLRYHRLFGVLIDPFLKLNPGLFAYYHDWGNRAYAFGPGIDLPIADLLGIRWVYARGTQFSDPQLVLRYRGTSASVYENSAAFPRAFVVHESRSVGSEAAMLAALSAARDDDLRNAVYTLGPAGTESIGALADGDAAAIVSYTPDRVALRVQSASPGLVLLSDTFAPGWTASVNGQDAPIMAADLAFRAVRVPPGTSDVVFAYRPVFTYLGFAVAAAALASLILWVGVMAFRTRARWHPAMPLSTTRD